MSSSIWAPGTNPVPLGYLLGLPGGAALVGMTPYGDMIGPTVQDALKELKDDIAAQPLNGSITTAKIVDGAVTTPKLADGVVTTAKVSSIASSKITFLAPWAGSIEQVLEDLLMEEVSVTRFMTVAQRANVAANLGSVDVTTAIQAAIDSSNTGIKIKFPRGTFLVSNTIYLRRSKVRLCGSGPGVTKLKYVNAAGGVVFSGDTAKNASLFTYSSCAIYDLEVISSGSAGTDASIVIDTTSFSYSFFDIEAQSQRNGAALYFGQGNNGQSPYFNRVISTGLFGGVDYSQDAFRFEGGAWTGGSNGPNANIIGPITRAAALNTIVNMKAGLQNQFSNINGESIGGTYFLLGGNAPVVMGTSTGSNGQVNFKDTGAAWGANAFVGGAIQITGGLGSGQIRTIASNSATQINVHEPWGIIPDATSMYSVFELKVSGNKFSHIRGEGLASLNPDFIYAYPGVDLTEFAFIDISSLGSGQYLWDYTGSARNSFYGGAKVTFTHTFLAPGASANKDAWSRTSVFGGQKVAGQYVIEWLKVSPQYFANGAIMNITLDAGGSATGNGTQTLTVEIPDGNDVGMALPRFDQKLSRDGTNTPMFLNLTTGAGFSATNSVTATVCVTLH